MRALPHMGYLSPKASILPTPPPLPERHRISLVLLTNTLIFIIHVFSTAPTAGETVRGYLHGGLLIDFVGVQGPVSKLRTAALDMLVLALQMMLVGVAREKAGLQGIGGGGTEAQVVTAQDLEAEERGELRGQEGLEMEMEMEELLHVQERDDCENAHTGIAAREPEHPLDPFYSAQRVIVNLHLRELVCVTRRRA